MIIGVDIDDVVADFINAANAYAKKYHNLDYSRESFETYSVIENWKLPEEQFNNIFMTWRNSKHFANMKTIEHSQHILNDFAKKHTIIFITSRNTDKEDVTTQWLKNNFNFPIKVLHTYNKYADDKTKKSKVETCREHKVDVMIEDQDSFAIECANGNIHVILLDNPWNKHTPEHKNITRVNSWLDIEKVIKNLEKRT